MKYFLGIICSLMSMAVFAQKVDSAAQIKDTTTKKMVVMAAKDTSSQKISMAATSKKDTMAKSKPTRSRVMLAGKLGVAGDSTSVDDILADPVVKPAKGFKFAVTAFEMAANYKGELHLLASKNDHLTKDMLKIIKDAMQGTPIIIQNVHYAYPDGKTGVMPGLVLCINK